MEITKTDARVQAHELIDQLPEAQLATAVGLLETMLDPVSLALRNAPVDDEPESEEGKLAAERAVEWLKHNKPIPLEEAIVRLGLSMEEVKDHSATD